MKVERYLGCRGTEEAQVGHLEQMRKAHASFLGIFFGAACDAIFQGDLLRSRVSSTESSDMKEWC